MAQSFYVDWEGRGYTPEHLKKDIELMKATLGDGPIYAGGSEDFMGYFFSGSPELGQVTATRGGRTSDGSAFQADDIHWQKFDSWDALAEGLQLFS